MNSDERETAPHPAAETSGTVEELARSADCPYCKCPKANHADNGLMVWCESDTCSRIGVEPFAPCIFDLDDEEIMAVFQREIHYR